MKSRNKLSPKKFCEKYWGQKNWVKKFWEKKFPKKILGSKNRRKIFGQKKLDIWVIGPKSRAQKYRAQKTGQVGLLGVKYRTMDTYKGIVHGDLIMDRYFGDKSCRRGLGGHRDIFLMNIRCQRHEIWLVESWQW